MFFLITKSNERKCSHQLPSRLHAAACSRRMELLLPSSHHFPISFSRMYISSPS
jgi:hypothetical protein